MRFRTSCESNRLRGEKPGTQSSRDAERRDHGAFANRDSHDLSRLRTKHLPHGKLTGAPRARP